ncbi:MAG TPA: hypothetical protein VHI50_16880 [Micromonosporaceae bacterium]|jgi:hypothetical protein|nr:hypothetical protein [Micromonosporaceae bacterium]
MRARRLCAALALAAVGVLALGACAKSSPSVAAYVGEKAFTKADVERAFDSVPEEQAQQNAESIRDFIVSMMVVGEVTKRHAEANGKTVPEGDTKAVAQGAGLPADNPLVELQARYQAAVQFLQSEAKPAEPDNTLRHELFDQLTAKGVVNPGTTFDDVRSAIDSEDLRHLVGVRNLLADLAERYHVRVNPAYGPLALQANGVSIANGQAQVDVDIPVTIEGEQFVTDLTTPAA